LLPSAFLLSTPCSPYLLPTSSPSLPSFLPPSLSPSSLPFFLLSFPLSLLLFLSLPPSLPPSCCLLFLQDLNLSFAIYFDFSRQPHYISQLVLNSLSSCLSLLSAKVTCMPHHTLLLAFSFYIVLLGQNHYGFMLEACVSSGCSS
jgi:hypothetical protein